MDSTAARLLDLSLWSAVVILMGAVAFRVIKKIRADSVQQEPTASELIAKFREMHSQGELSDAEFRTIKTTLAVKLQEELKDNGQQV